jgi:pimeloyl-ACP methyl ester carboxylesterase
MAEGYARRLEDSGLASIADSDELRADAHRDTSGLILAARHLLVQHDARVLEGLPSIAVPTLVIVGSEDTAFLGGSEYMAAKIPGARLEVIPGARHAPNVTDPERFNRVVLEFLAALP